MLYNMYLLHTIFGNEFDDYKKILTDGKLKSSSKTKNIKMYGWDEGSKYIFLRIDQKGDYANLYLDYKLLLETNFYLHTGWKGEPHGEKINGKKLTLEQLDTLLDDFKKEIKLYKKNRKKNAKFPIDAMMTNEILVEKNIDLNKYLKKIKLPFNAKKNQELVNIAKNINPDIEF